VATAQVQCLALESGNLEDGGAALVEAVKQGCGARELQFLRGYPFDSSEYIVTFIVTFINALRGNEHLERLHLPLIVDHQQTLALAAALHENKGLVHLAVHYHTMYESGLIELLKSISLHPSLRSLDLTMDRMDIDPKKRITKAIADMLSVNERIEKMSFDDGTFYKDDWDAYVVPRLECNLYRKRSLSIQKIGEASTRAAVLARTLATFACKPHLVWMLLSQNHDILSSYQDTAHDRDSISPRKRSRSPSY
jgi:hypothetical protein